MYTLINKISGTRRTYTSSITGTEISTKLIYTDGSGNNWWAFEDLLQMPFIRKKAAEKVSQLYGVGITKEDLSNFVTKMKNTLRGADAERYEKAYSEVLNLESIIESTADPVKESLSLCTVYIMQDDERVDNFSYQQAARKVELWTLDTDAQAFFLTWLAAGINDYTQHYKSIMQIASTLQK